MPQPAISLNPIGLRACAGALLSKACTVFGSDFGRIVRQVKPAGGPRARSGPLFQDGHGGRNEGRGPAAAPALPVAGRPLAPRGPPPRPRSEPAEGQPEFRSSPVVKILGGGPWAKGESWSLAVSVSS